MAHLLSEVDIRPYEGLVFVTAQRFGGMIGVEQEDLQQILRLKIAQALLSYSPARSKLTVERYVFSCMRNKVKDLVRDQHARARWGGECFLEDMAPTDDRDTVRSRDHFEHTMGMAVTADEVFAATDEGSFKLPSTLTKHEADVLLLMVLDFNQREIAVRLGTTKGNVRRAHAALQIKMADWRPTSAVRARVAA